jgi:hypothetical protein
MTAFEAYCVFQAINFHFFRPTYDYFKYGGKVSTKYETFENKRQDEIYRYERLSKKFTTKEELENFLVANMLVSSKSMWVGAVFGAEAEQVYNEWMGRIQGIRYLVTSDVKRLLNAGEAFNDLFATECDGEGHQHPPILKAFKQHVIHLETFVILDLCVGFSRKLDKDLKGDPVWEQDVRLKCLKYRPFLERANINFKELKKAVLNTVVQEADLNS